MAADRAEGGQPRSVIEFHVALIDMDPFFIHWSTYPNWMDRGFLDLLRVVGRPLNTIFAEGYGFPMVQLHADFRAPAHLDDLLRLTTAVAAVGKTSLTVGYEFARVEPDGALTPLVQARTVHVCTVRATMRPRPVPDWMRAAAPAAS